MRRSTILGLCAAALTISAALSASSALGVGEHRRRDDPSDQRRRVPAARRSLRTRLGLGSMWIVRGDGSTTRSSIASTRPRTPGASSDTWRFPATGVAVGYGSLWVADYFGNAVWRVSPRGRAQARIRDRAATRGGARCVRVGLGRQSPRAFGDPHRSAHRTPSRQPIRPATRPASAAVPRTSPATPTGSTSASSDQSALQSIDPATNATTTPAATDDQFCGPLTFIGGSIWNSDRCTQHAVPDLARRRRPVAHHLRARLRIGTPQVLAQTRFDPSCGSPSTSRTTTTRPPARTACSSSATRQRQRCSAP